jgi:hypothetical protein
MFEPRSLAGFMSAYPGRSVELFHQLARDPRLSLPNLSLVAGNFPDQSVSILTPPGVPAPAPALAILGTAAPATIVRLCNLDNDDAYARLVRELTAVLRPILAACGERNVDFQADAVVGSSQSVINATGPQIICVFRGHAVASIPQLDQTILDENNALFIPSGTAIELACGQQGTAFLEITWQADKDTRGDWPRAIGRIGRRLASRWPRIRLRATRRACPSRPPALA